MPTTLFLLCVAIFVQLNSGCTFNIDNSDFTEGTLIIESPGIYCITENIVFEPETFNSNPVAAALDSQISSNPELIDGFPVEPEYIGVAKMRDGPYSLGFLGVIQINANDVILDLQGNTISMSKHYAIQQRWGAIIQIGNTPFEKEGTNAKTTGPTNFLETNVGNSNLDHITIKNGNLGLSSHHGILANRVKNLEIKDLDVSKFEVAGIQVNGFEHLKMSNIKVHDSVTDLPVNAQYSSGRYLLQAFIKSKLHTSDNFVGTDSPDTPTRPGFRKRYKDVYEDLRTVMHLTYKHAIGLGLTVAEQNSDLWKNNKNIFVNADGLPDGATLYGIIVHSFHPAIAGFGKGTRFDMSLQAELKDITVENLKIKTREIPVVNWNKCQSPGVAARNDLSLRGPFGDLLDFEKMFSEEYQLLFAEGKKDIIFGNSNVKYVGNVLADAKIASSYFKKGLVSSGNTLQNGDNKAWEDSTKNPFLNWVFHEATLSDCEKEWQCNRDVMGHWVKGVIGIRLEEVEHIKLNGIKVENIHNESPLASKSCNTFDDQDEGSFNGDVRAISTSTANLEFTTSIGTSSIQNSIDKLSSDYGDVTAFYVTGKPDKTNVDYETSAQRFTIGVGLGHLESGKKLAQNIIDDLRTPHLPVSKIPIPYNFFQCPYHFTTKSRQRSDVEAPIKCTDRLADFSNYDKTIYDKDIFSQIIGI